MACFIPAFTMAMGTEKLSVEAEGFQFHNSEGSHAPLTLGGNAGKIPLAFLLILLLFL